MSSRAPRATRDRAPLRLRPGLTLAGLLIVLRFGVPLVAPGYEWFRVAFAGGFFGFVAILLWWTFWSRAPISERWGAPAVLFVALAATWRLNHESMGLMWAVYYAMPLLGLALVAWAATARRLARGARWAALAALLAVSCGAWTLVRMEGLTGDHVFHFAWRWTADTEAFPGATADPTVPDPASRVEIEYGTAWPGFRGAHRDGVVRGTRLATDWDRSPPRELWRRPVGAGWSSFALGRGLACTQEQRGPRETVSCFDAWTGDERWTHSDAARFYESMGGPGPRATPLMVDGRLYTLGATGKLSAFELDGGSRLWSRDVGTDTGTKLPIWGFAGSPLPAGGHLLVAASGRLVAYDPDTGDLRWSGPDGGASYSSPHLMTLGGLEQIVLLSDAGATGLALDGGVLWEHSWPGAALVQPAATTDGDLLISAGEGKGLRRLAVTPGAPDWAVEERWTIHRMKPNFNDLAVHGDHAFGFDGSILACIDLQTGERLWKGGRYGHGQLLLLSDQDLLLVLSEKGEVALVSATTERFSELARFRAIEGKTWNHPVLVDDLLLVRNGREMAAFRLPLANEQLASN